MFTVVSPSTPILSGTNSGYHSKQFSLDKLFTVKNYQLKDNS